ncbi:MAG: hypothetical protein M3P43_04330 [Actinomycetota bacterium]|nr:hypothetical protein [Actinomycetota bacterium]
MLKGSARHIARRWVTRHPVVYLPIARSRKRNAAVDQGTDIVIDGFYRSAGTFSVIAFQLAQNNHLRVAHHLHAAAQFIAAAELGTPTLITVRPPEPTILSAMLREPVVTPGQWLKFYAEFYERILPIRDRFVVATFDDVTSDFGAVTRRINQRFRTNFKEFRHTEENVATCFALIEERSEGPPWGDPLRRFLSGIISADEYWAATRPYREERERYWHDVPEHRIARPSQEREAFKTEVRSRYLVPRLTGLRRRAEQAYEDFAG